MFVWSSKKIIIKEFTMTAMSHPPKMDIKKGAKKEGETSLNAKTIRGIHPTTSRHECIEQRHRSAVFW